MKTLITSIHNSWFTEYGWMIFVIAGGIFFVAIIVKGFLNAKTVDDKSDGLTQRETDAFMQLSKKSSKDKHLLSLLNQWGRKHYGDNSVNKREFTNRSDVTEDDLKFVKGMK